MKYLYTIAFSMLFSFCYAQADLVNDTTESGGITTDSVMEERYDVNHVVYFPLLTFNVANLVGLDVLELGKTYTFEIDFENLLDRDVVLGYVSTECICEEATWAKNAIPSSLKRKVTIKFTATVPGNYTSTIKMFAQNVAGTIPLAIQPVQLVYVVQ